MQLIISPFTQAAENLAFEEYLFKSTTDDICLIYRNKSSVIVGKHQNVFAEVNLPYCQEHNIPVLRRISGGGTVYHDLGNINISLIKTEKGENKVNYQPLLDLIIEFLATQGLAISQGERNDLYLGDKKITGTACHIFKSRTLHHGTLLFDANMIHLKGSTNHKIKVATKGVQSKRSSVANCKTALTKSATAEQMIQYFERFITDSRQWHLATLDVNVRKELETAIIERYANADWNIDYSPKADILWGTSEKSYQLHVIKGRIVSITEIEGEEKNDTNNMPQINMRMYDLLMS